MRLRNGGTAAVLSALLLAGIPGSVAAAGSRGGNPYVCGELVRKLDVVARHDERRERDFLLFEAARKGCMDVARKLIDQGASVAARNRFGNTALHMAAAAGHTDLVELLLDHGADIDRPNLGGRTPLMKAVEAERRRVVRLLLQRGADPRRADAEGITALTIAAFNGDMRSVKRLLAAGVDPDPVDRTGKSPLLYASARGFADIVGRLLEAGVDPRRTYGHDLTALMWAAGHSNDVPAKDAIATAKLLIGHGAPLDARDDRGMTALMIAAARGHAEMVDFLLGRGADPHLRDRRGRDALALARDDAVRARLLAAAAQSAAR